MKLRSEVASNLVVEKKRATNRFYLITINVDANWKFINEKLMRVNTNFISFILLCIQIRGKSFTKTKTCTKKFNILFRIHCWTSLIMKNYFEPFGKCTIFQRFFWMHRFQFGLNGNIAFRAQQWRVNYNERLSSL